LADRQTLVVERIAPPNPKTSGFNSAKTRHKSNGISQSPDDSAWRPLGSGSTNSVPGLRVGCTLKTVPLGFWNPPVLRNGHEAYARRRSQSQLGSERHLANLAAPKQRPAAVKAASTGLPAVNRIEGTT
jgi:hypothetical protein